MTMKISRDKLYNEEPNMKNKSFKILILVTFATLCFFSLGATSIFADEVGSNGSDLLTNIVAKVYQDDDAKNECFRKYSNAAKSYEDHSDFLRGARRYAPLFDLEPTDYKGWAYGLKKAGYATIDALIKAGRLDVSKAKNVGEKSLKVIDAWLKERGFTWK